MLPEVFDPVLSRLRSEAPQHFGAAGVQLVPVAYEDRPFSHLLRVGARR